MKAERLSAEEIEQKLSSCPGWELRNGKLHRELVFDDFVQAFSFMTKAALISEKRNHHPEWFNVYNRVVIDLCTHECDGVSARDFQWINDVSNLL